MLFTDNFQHLLFSDGNNMYLLRFECSLVSFASCSIHVHVLCFFKPGSDLNKCVSGICFSHTYSDQDLH